MELTVSGLTKQYQAVTALDDMNARLQPGVYGVLGPNGAGKSTLMNLLTDNLEPTRGQVLYDKQDIRQMGREYRALLGYMPQQQALYAEMTGLRFLWYVAALKGLHRRKARLRIEELLALVNLEQDAHKRLGGYSGGMKQRILLAQALLNDPKVLILDEPTAGLDPKERIRVRNHISAIAQDKIVIVATHVVPDIEYIASWVLLMKKGRLAAQGSPVELTQKMEGQVFEVRCAQEDVPNLTAACKVSNLAQERDGVALRVVGTPPAGFEATAVKPTLEDVYLYTVDEA